MDIDPIAARFAQQSVQEAQARSKAALLKYDEESILIRETSDKFYGSLALFSGGKVVHDANFNKFKALMNARSQKSEQDWFSSQWVTATFVGRVDAGVSGNPHTAHGKRKSITGGNGGFGHENLFDAQFVLQSVQGDAVIGTARNGTASLK
jgi:hypothetical protein